MTLDRLRSLHLFSLGLWRYPAATLFVAIALLLALALQPYVSQSPFLPFIAAVMVSAGVTGLRSALFATALSVLLADYFLIPPLGTLYVAAPPLIPMGLFVIEAVLISYFIEYLGIARRSAAKAEADVRGLYLHSRRLLEGKALGPMLEQTLSAAMELMHSEKAVIHVYDRQHHAVQLMAQIGFPDSISERFGKCRRGDRHAAPQPSAADGSSWRTLDTTPSLAISPPSLPSMVSSRFNLRHCSGKTARSLASYPPTGARRIDHRHQH